jgi:hypothetical protein
MQRWIAGIFAALNSANGLAMLLASSTWWPFNPHFVQDVGAAFLAAGMAQGFRAWRPNYWPAALAVYSAFPAKGEHNAQASRAPHVETFSRPYGYDISYAEMMLQQSPAAFFKFAPVMKAAAHREVVSVQASFAAKITGAVAQDCGPCTQLVVDMALEAGMAKDQIEAVLRRNLKAMTTASSQAVAPETSRRDGRT